jgi:hypothetical protein
VWYYVGEQFEHPFPSTPAWQPGFCLLAGLLPDGPFHLPLRACLLPEPPAGPNDPESTPHAGVLWCFGALAQTACGRPC